MSNPCKKCGWEDRHEHLWGYPRKTCHRCDYLHYRSLVRVINPNVKEQSPNPVNHWAIDKDFDEYNGDLRKLIL